MFERPHYISNSFALIFPRQPTIRRRANDFEDRLKGMYVQPQIVPVPDELDPQIPRIIFGSEHGYSHIAISQIDFRLNVTYSSDWQIDIPKGRSYLKERVSILFELLDLIEGLVPCYSGLTTVVTLPSKADDGTIIRHLIDRLIAQSFSDDTHDIYLKVTTVLSDHFFSNVTMLNYHSWNIEEAVHAIARLPRKHASERGIQIIGDFNDRYAFNEKSDYKTTREMAHVIIEKGLDEMGNAIDTIQKVQP